jgi:hypothetical protein
MNRVPIYNIALTLTLVLLLVGGASAADPLTDSAGTLAGASQQVNVVGMLALLLALSEGEKAWSRRQDRLSREKDSELDRAMRREMHELSKKYDATLTSNTNTISRLRRDFRKSARDFEKKSTDRDKQLRADISEDFKKFGVEIKEALSTALVEGQKAAADILAHKYEQMRTGDEARIEARITAAMSVFGSRQEAHPLPPPAADPPSMAGGKSDSADGNPAVG